MSTFTGYTASSGDSGWQAVNGTTNTITATTSQVAYVTGDTPPASYAGIHIANVTVAGSATVSAATLSVYVYGKYKTMSGKIYGVKEANPGVFAATASYLQNLVGSYPTTNTVKWGPSTLTSPAYNASPDLTAVISELIAQGSWASGNAMAFVIVAQTNGDTCAYYGEPYGSDFENLSITYTAGGGTTNITAALTASAAVAGANAESVALTGNLT